jgi:DNA helicase-2/ATP-dependent DNA helicase PcrA
VEQLTMTLDGLPAPLSPQPEDTGLLTSVTGLVTYATCPQRFRWAEVDRLPRRPSAAARRGVEVHRRIEIHNRGAVPLTDLDDDLYDAPAAGGGEPAAAAYETFLGSRFAAQRPLLVEAPFDLRLEDARVRGRIDAIYEDEPGAWEVVDFKSGRPTDDPARRVQLQAYALATQEAGFAGAPPHRLAVTFAYLGAGLVEEREEVDGDWLAEARNHVGALVRGAAAREFAADPSAACRGCDFLHVCAEGRAWVEDDR